MSLDFTRPYIRGLRVIVRKGNEPPRLEKVIKTVPMRDPKTGKVLPSDPEVIHGCPGRKNYRIRLNGNTSKTE